MAALLERSLAKDPSVRPPDAGAFLAELEDAAEEKYGAAWRSRASIAGLVASTVGVAAGSAAAGGAAAPTVVAQGLPQAVTGATDAAVSTGRRVGIKTIVAAGATAAVVVAGAVVGLTLAGNNNDPDGDSSSQPTLSDEERREQERERQQEEREEKIAELEAGVVTGKYNVKDTADRVVPLGGSTKIAPNSFTWTFSPARCTASDCRGTIKSSGGAKGLKFTWDGRTMSVTLPPTVDKNAPCYDAETGEQSPISQSSWSGTYTYTFDPASAPAGSDGLPPRRFTIQRTGVFSDYSLGGDCEWSDTTWKRLESTLQFTRAGR